MRIQNFGIVSVLALFISACAPFQGPGRMNGMGRLHGPEVYRNQRGGQNPHIYRNIYKTPRRTGPLQLGWPVDRIRITQGFAAPKNPRHQGMDLDGRRNDPIYAAHDGTVVYSGSSFNGYGKMIILEYNGQWATLYGHLNNYYVKGGDQIQRGELIGRMGRTGRATGVHLHFEVIKNKQPIDPAPLLPNRDSLANR